MFFDCICQRILYVAFLWPILQQPTKTLTTKADFFRAFTSYKVKFRHMKGCRVPMNIHFKRCLHEVYASNWRSCLYHLYIRNAFIGFTNQHTVLAVFLCNRYNSIGNSFECLDFIRDRRCCQPNVVLLFRARWRNRRP